jgi:hypothetical protein
VADKKFGAPDNAANRQFFGFKPLEKTPADIARGACQKDQGFHRLFLSSRPVFKLWGKSCQIAGRHRPGTDGHGYIETHGYQTRNLGGFAFRLPAMPFLNPIDPDH